MLFINRMKDLERVGKKVFQEVISTNKVKKIWQEWKKRAAVLFKYCRKINPPYLKTLTDNELKSCWKNFNKLGFLFWEVGILPELGAYGGEVELHKILKKEQLPAFKEREAFSILSAPIGLSFYQEEERDLLKVMQQRHTRIFKCLLNRHQRKYFWLENSYYETKVLKSDFFQRRVQEKIKAKVRPAFVLKSMQQHLDQARQQKSRIIADFKNKKAIKRVADLLSYCIWWQDHRKKFIFKYLHYFTLLINEFARRSKISPRVFDLAWVNEVQLYPPRRLVLQLKKRKKGYYAAHFWKNNKRFYYGKRAKSIYNRFWTRPGTVKADKIEGTVVFAVKKPITGKVFLIKEVRDIKKFPSNRILVTSMTAPEYITAIRKAKAIVTDTGGLTCHAAIVSRELKVPCIVGTKIATKVFKDGDKVEVDATKGVVKKLG
jgi:phosphohistidine swiveling domain-containing protein